MLDICTCSLQGSDSSVKFLNASDLDTNLWRALKSPWKFQYSLYSLKTGKWTCFCESQCFEKFFAHGRHMRKHRLQNAHSPIALKKKEVHSFWKLAFQWTQCFSWVILAMAMCSGVQHYHGRRALARLPWQPSWRHHFFAARHIAVSLTIGKCVLSAKFACSVRRKCILQF